MVDVENAIAKAVSQLERNMPEALERSKSLNFVEVEAQLRCFRFFESQGFPLQVNDERLGEQICAAEGGDAAADACLRVAAAMFLERGQTVPVSLGSYIARSLRASLPRPRKHRLQNRARDGVIFDCINDAIKLGFSPTRNAASRGREDCTLSACAIVATALSKIGMHISEEAVEKVWNKMTGPNLIFARPKQMVRNV